MFNGSGSDYQDTTITNDGFWPDLNVGDFERRRGTPPAQDDDRIAFALTNAISSCNIDLTRLKQRYVEAGHDKAENIPAYPMIELKNQVVIQYEAAVFARAKADLLPDFSTVTTRKEGDHLAERADETKQELLAECTRIIRNMYGKGRASVALI
ncbi:head completion/stabilization protein [Vibrio sp. 10N.261.55.A7]|uniref:head completion/stabilization protein n=1 Tax=Vibrio sp. 10N.261.55.A7 TaxID=1880851 RepID=UPI000C8587C2|nr:head completion/stabilization protein [Vibrio sp. 10N.261.55.A7]PMJ92853.1 head protein [Vibrio sp. 10N.261.55.A7]